MNLVALEKIDWLVSNFWGKQVGDYLRSIGIDYPPDMNFAAFLNALSVRGDDSRIVKIINLVFMDSNFKSTYKSGWEFYFVKVRDIADELVELLKMEGYRVENFKVFPKTEADKVTFDSIQLPLIESKYFQDKFYVDIVREINAAYQCGLPSATWILLRKILENLLIDCLRAKYSTVRLDLFYRTDRRRFQDFSKLLGNFKDNLDDFKPYSASLDLTTVSILEHFKETGNSHAHSIDLLATLESIEQQKEQINYVIHLLYSLKNNIK